ncbi:MULTISPECIES: helix-turn-helix domain-containing protein [Bizionia]|uniref:Helix-turn-helix domain-containing protein n=2 Tax=Bizionia TaxID=283785 RepID=A0A5D0QX79_9FLAO|nr:MULTISPECIES: helix-turn-helix domain-containing protein [Bizionia]OBX23391.1 transcriptional regulator [Bizionia sp. APA-3]TYB73385.1 helix-turn-helix domain-containing protein [Bizionia algoritergicola]TYB74044.1 helix-turn-helix domain-containing protein [Bizionia myxarmorum]UPS91244.1 helix-turn-helix domain-containing protein [Bizionia sp. M204]|tara:strand:+ start:312 stop:581 length:270 start_codon:yes stop_codon:yes gene_type:complete
MPTTILTTDDLYQFKMELFDEMKSLLSNAQPSKKYLRSTEVMKLLQVSPGTLQNLRVNGTIPYTKLGGIIYYDQEDINKVLEDNRMHHV